MAAVLRDGHDAWADIRRAGGDRRLRRVGENEQRVRVVAVDCDPDFVRLVQRENGLAADELNWNVLAVRAHIDRCDRSSCFRDSHGDLAGRPKGQKVDGGIRAGMPVSNARTAESVDVRGDPIGAIEDFDGVQARFVSVYARTRVDLDAGGAD